jgi:hypothetical protein
MFNIVCFSDYQTVPRNANLLFHLSSECLGGFRYRKQPKTILMRIITPKIVLFSSSNILSSVSFGMLFEIVQVVG